MFVVDFNGVQLIVPKNKNILFLNQVGYWLENFTQQSYSDYLNKNHQFNFSLYINK